MKKKLFKQVISLCCAASLILGNFGELKFSMSSVVFADVVEGDVEINEQNFPDEGFRKKIEAGFDSDQDGILSGEERSITSMNISGSDISNNENPKITSLQGIEYFPNLTQLSCENQEICVLDVSSLEALNQIDCVGNPIYAIKVHDKFSGSISTYNYFYGGIEHYIFNKKKADNNSVFRFRRTGCFKNE